MSAAWCAIRVEFHDDGADADTVNMVLGRLAGLNVELTIKGQPPVSAAILDANTQVVDGDGTDNQMGFAWQRLDHNAYEVGPVEKVLYQDVETIRVY